MHIFGKLFDTSIEAGKRGFQVQRGKHRAILCAKHNLHVNRNRAKNSSFEKPGLTSPLCSMNRRAPDNPEPTHGLRGALSPCYSTQLQAMDGEIPTQKNSRGGLSSCLESHRGDAWITSRQNDTIIPTLPANAITAPSGECLQSITNLTASRNSSTLGFCLQESSRVREKQVLYTPCLPHRAFLVSKEPEVKGLDESFRHQQLRHAGNILIPRKALITPC